MKKTILTILITAIICIIGTASAAYVYTARDIGYQSSDESWSVNNVQEAISELKTDVNNINNKVEGIERIYKAGEVELVALVSDDSFYTDSNGKYVLSNSDTGRALLADTSTYKSLSSTDDCVGIVGEDIVNILKTSKDFNVHTEYSKIKNSSSGEWRTDLENFIVQSSGKLIIIQRLNANSSNQNIKISKNGVVIIENNKTINCIDVDVNDVIHVDYYIPSGCTYRVEFIN